MSSTSSIPGTALRVREFLVVLLAGVVGFVVWDGPLWQADGEASHLGRIVGSYLLVVPLTVWALARRGQASTSNVTSAVAALWGVKLVTTSILYNLLAPGAVTHYAPAAVPDVAEAPASTQSYVPAKDGFAGVDLRGRWAQGRGLVYLEAPRPGRPLPPPSAREWRLEADRRVTLSGTTRDRLILVNDSDTPKDVELRKDDHAIRTVTVPEQGRRRLTMPRDGWYELRAGTDRRADLLVTDHPYVTRPDAAGRWVLPRVAPGPARLAWGPSFHRVQVRTIEITERLEEVELL